jgi:hypothetical protein
MTTMSIFDATMIAEGVDEADSEEQYVAAWQLLIDSGVVWQLQGWFGRTARDLIEQGVCTDEPS